MKKKIIDRKKLQIVECERKIKDATRQGNTTLQFKLNSELRDLKNEYTILQEKYQNIILYINKTTLKVGLITFFIACCIFFGIRYYI